MKKRVIIRYRGRVQGVGFRATVLHHAEGLDIHGFVCNEPDGTVLLDVEGPKTHLDELIERIRTRPAGSIEQSDIRWDQPTGRDDGFSIA